REARRSNMLALNVSHKGQSRPELCFPRPWVSTDQGKFLKEYTASPEGKEHQKQANRLGNHIRWHKNRGVIQDSCGLCVPMNHKVISVTSAGYADVGDFSVEKYHNFA